MLRSDVFGCISFRCLCSSYDRARGRNKLCVMVWLSLSLEEVGASELRCHPSKFGLGVGLLFGCHGKDFVSVADGVKDMVPYLLLPTLWIFFPFIKDVPELTIVGLYLPIINQCFGISTFGYLFVPRFSSKR